jgi:hypothetical protein
MFCPVGYVPFAELTWLCGLAARNEMPDGFKSDSLIARNDYDLARRFFYAWLIARSMQTMPVYICSREGMIFRASPGMLSHKEDLSAL